MLSLPDFEKPQLIELIFMSCTLYVWNDTATMVEGSEVYDT